MSTSTRKSICRYEFDHVNEEGESERIFGFQVVTWNEKEEVRAAVNALAGVGVKLEVVEADKGASPVPIVNLANGLIKAKSAGQQAATVDGARMNELERSVRNTRRDIDKLTAAIDTLTKVVGDAVVEVKKATAPVTQVIAMPTGPRRHVVDEEDVYGDHERRRHEHDIERRAHHDEQRARAIREERISDEMYDAPVDTASAPRGPDAFPILGAEVPRRVRTENRSIQEVASPTLAPSGRVMSEQQEFDGERWVKVPLPTVGDSLTRRSDIEIG